MMSLLLELGMRKKTKAGRTCYPLGRIITYQDYMLLAFSHFENNQAKLSHNDYEICLRAMWNEISRVYANRPITIPSSTSLYPLHA